MRKALLITLVFFVLTLSITQAAIAQKANIITNQTTEPLYVIYSTKFGSHGVIPAGYWTVGWKRISVGQQETFWAYDPHKIYFQIWKGHQRVKPRRSTQTFAFWINPNADFNVVTRQEINASITRGQLVYSSHDPGVLMRRDGFMRYNNDSRITVTDAWVDVDDDADAGLDMIEDVTDREVFGWDTVEALRAHTGAINALAWHPTNSQRLASGSSDRVVRVWHFAEITTSVPLRGHTGAVFCLAWTDDGKLVSGGVGNILHTWDPRAGRLVESGERNAESIYSVAWWSARRGTVTTTADETSLDISLDERIVVGLTDKTVQIWSLDPHQHTHTLTGHTGSVNAVAWSPDDARVVSGSADRTVRVWDPQTGRLLRTLRGHTGGVNAIAWSPDGTRVVSGSDDGTVRIWDAQVGALLETLRGHTGGVNAVAWSPDGTRIASGGADNIIRLWEKAEDSDMRSDGAEEVFEEEVFDDGMSEGVAEEVFDEGMSDGDAAVVSINLPQVVPAVGSQLTIPLKITNAQNVFGYQATLNFDPSELRYISSAYADYPSAGAFFVPPQISEGRVVFAVAGTGDEVGAASGTLATVTFEVVVSKKPTIWLTDVVLAGRGGEDLDPDAPINIPDPNLRAAIEDELDKTQGAPITRADMLKLIQLFAHDRGIENLTGLEVATNLSGLALNNNNISDVSPLRTLTNLRILLLNNNEISDFSPIAGLIPNLQAYGNANQRENYDFCFAENPFLLNSLNSPVPDASDDSLQTEQLALVVPKLWTKAHTTYTETATDGIVLTVGFQGGDAPSRNLVKTHAPEWSKHGAVRFRFPESSSEWDIIVSFNTGKNDPSKSAIGIGSLEDARKGKPSMNINFTKTYCGGDKGVILHEFGHALGFHHEHVSPAAGIDVAKAIKEARPSVTKRFRAMAQEEGWSAEKLEMKIEANLDANYGILSSNPTYTNFTEYDPNSIMLYSGLPLKGGGETGCNGDLSDLDKQGIGAFYPKPDTTPSSIDISVKWYPLGQETLLQDGGTVPTEAPLGVSVTVYNSHGEPIPKRSVRLDVKTGAFSEASIAPSVIITGASGEAATAKARLSGADEYNTILAQVPGTNLEKSVKLFIKGVTESYDKDFYFKVNARNSGTKRDWERTFTVVDPIMTNRGTNHGQYNISESSKWKWRAKITGVTTRGRAICGVVCGSAGIDDKVTVSGDTATIRGWVEDGVFKKASFEGRIYIKYDVIRSKKPIYSVNVVVGAAPANPLVVDVNGDGHVDTSDLVLVSNAIGQTGSIDPRLDVSGDGIVSIADLVWVAQYLDTSTYASAPVAVRVPVGLEYRTVEGWLKQAQAEDDGSLAFQQGIAKLEYLLTLIIPEETALLANYPNPFNPETWIPYHLTEPADVTLTIYAVDGGVVRHLDLGHQAAGYYQSKARAAYWDGRNARGERVASGIYFYTLKAGDFSATKKMLIRK